jgi:hypothetical protein
MITAAPAETRGTIMLLPPPRGPLSAAVTAAIRRPDDALIKVPVLAEPDAALHDPDFQLTLWVLYELHYRSFDDAPDSAEWSPVLLAVRGALESIFDTALERECAGPVELLAAVPADDFPDQLFALAESFDGPPISEHIQRRATLDQVREMLLLRSLYQLKEADPHSFAIPATAAPTECTRICTRPLCAVPASIPATAPMSRWCPRRLW